MPKASPDFASASIAAENTFTDPLRLASGDRASVSLSGIWVATVHLQRRFAADEGGDGATGWLDVISFTVNEEGEYEADEACDIRLGVKAGGYTSGTVTARVGVR